MRCAILLAALALLAASPAARAQEPTAAPTATWESITDLVTSRADRSILESALEAAGLSEELSDPTLRATLFAPSNDAFTALLEQLGLTAEELLANTELLTTVLSYHLIPGEVLTSEQLEGDLVLQTSLGGQAGEIRVLPGLTRPRLETSSGQVVPVSNADLVAGAAIVHGINTVLLPDMSALSMAPAPAPSTGCTYTLEDGEFLFSVAQSLGLPNEADLLALNPGITDPDSVLAGTEINVPC